MVDLAGMSLDGQSVLPRSGPLIVCVGIVGVVASMPSSMFVRRKPMKARGSDQKSMKIN